MKNLSLFTKFKPLYIGFSKLIHLGIAFMVLFFVQIQVFAGDRGRPHLDNSKGFNRLLTDKNTLLRGVSLSWDGGDNYYHDLPPVLPTQDQLNAIYNTYGFNCIHLYLEMDAPTPPDNHMQVVGRNAALCDQLVNMASQANLYVIITIGCGNYNGQIYNMNWSLDFWNFYAPRYANRTHVIYESHNEPAPNTPSQWKTSDWDNQVTLYNTIRAKAPNTHILTCTFMGFTSPTLALNGIGYMRWKGVDFSNASVAFHGYENQASIQTCISQFKYDTGGGITPALLCTEFDPGTTTSTRFNNMLESENVGWLEFMFLRADNYDLDLLRSRLQSVNVTWTPDSKIGIIPFGQTIWLQNSGKYVSSNNGGSPITCDRPNVQGWEKFVVVDAGNWKVALRGSNGKYVSSENGTSPMTCNRPSYSDWEKFDWVVVGNQVALKGNNGKFVSSENGATSGMNCNRPSPQGWELFNWGTTSMSSMVATSLVSESINDKFYPNPCIDMVHFDNLDGASSVAFFDMYGRLVLKQQLVPNTNTIDVTTLKSGVYSAKVSKNNSESTIMILKK